MSPSTTKLLRIKNTAQGEHAGTGLGHYPEPHPHTQKFWTAAAPEMKAAAVTECYLNTDGSMAWVSHIFEFLSQIQLDFFQIRFHVPFWKDISPHGDLKFLKPHLFLGWRTQSMLNDVNKPQQQHGPLGHSADSREWSVVLAETPELTTGPGQLRVRPSTGLQLDPKPSLVARDRLATHATFSHWQPSRETCPLLCLRVRHPGLRRCSFLSFSLFVYIQLNSDVLPEWSRHTKTPLFPTGF